MSCFFFSSVNRPTFYNHTVIYCFLSNVTRFLFSLDESFLSYGDAVISDLASFLTAQ